LIELEIALFVPCSIKRRTAGGDRWLFSVCPRNVFFSEASLEQQPNLPVDSKARHSTKGGLGLILISRHEGGLKLNISLGLRFSVVKGIQGSENYRRIDET